MERKHVSYCPASYSAALKLEAYVGSSGSSLSAYRRQMKDQHQVATLRYTTSQKKIYISIKLSSPVMEGKVCVQ